MQKNKYFQKHHICQTEIQGFKPLNDEDISYIIEEMKTLELDEKYSKEKWRIN